MTHSRAVGSGDGGWRVESTVGHARSGRAACRSVAAALGAAWLLFHSGTASAIQGEPAVFAGVGVERWGGEVSGGASLAALGGRYGVGEWVDLRALASASRLDLCGARAKGAETCGDQTWHLALGAMLAFKLDVIQWVPYAGPLFSYHLLTGGPVPLDSYPHDLGAGAALGVDYVPVREYGVGLQAGYQGLLRGFADGGYDRGVLTAELRLEYRWGW